MVIGMVFIIEGFPYFISPEKWKEAGADILNQLVISLPFGRNLPQGWDGWSAGVDPLPVVWQTGRTMESLLDDSKDREADARAVRDLLLESLVLVGAPTVQIERTMRTFIDEDWHAQFEPWELVGGPPEEEK